MSAVSKIQSLLTEEILASGLFARTMIQVPVAGATDKAIEDLERALPRSVSAAHRAILCRWNGLDLDVVRILGVPPVEPGFKTILDFQPLIESDTRLSTGVVFATDPSGFLYIEKSDGSIYSVDHDGGEITFCASTVDEFFDVLVFGNRSSEFLGHQWLYTLQRLGIVAP